MVLPLTRLVSVFIIFYFPLYLFSSLDKRNNSNKCKYRTNQQFVRHDDASPTPCPSVSAALWNCPVFSASFAWPVKKEEKKEKRKNSLPVTVHHESLKCAQSDKFAIANQLYCVKVTWLTCPPSRLSDFLTFIYLTCLFVTLYWVTLPSYKLCILSSFPFLQPTTTQFLVVSKREEKTWCFFPFLLHT